MSEKRSVRQKKEIAYNGMDGDEDGDEDFKPSSKTRISKESFSSSPSSQSMRKERLSIAEKVFDRNTNQAIEISKKSDKKSVTFADEQKAEKNNNMKKNKKTIDTNIKSPIVVVNVDNIENNTNFSEKLPGNVTSIVDVKDCSNNKENELIGDAVLKVEVSSCEEVVRLVKDGGGGGVVEECVSVDDVRKQEENVGGEESFANAGSASNVATQGGLSSAPAVKNDANLQHPKSSTDGVSSKNKNDNDEIVALNDKNNNENVKNNKNNKNDKKTINKEIDGYLEGDDVRDKIKTGRTGAKKRTYSDMVDDDDDDDDDDVEFEDEDDDDDDDYEEEEFTSKKTKKENIKDTKNMKVDKKKTVSNSSNKNKKATTTTNNNNKNPVLSKRKNCISDKKLDLPKGTGRMGGLVKKPSTPSSSSSLSSPSLPKSSTSSLLSKSPGIRLGLSKNSRIKPLLGNR